MKRVPIDQLQPGMVLAQDVFVAQESDSAVLLTGASLTARSIDRLKNWKLEQVFVEGEEEFPTFVPPPREDTGHITNLLHQARSSVPAPAPTISAELREQSLDVLQNIFESTDPGGEIHASAQLVAGLDVVVDQLVESLLSEQNALVNISDLKSYDDYTYHHSLSVAVMSIGLGQYMGISGRQLNGLGLCAIMHDIGKTAIPVEIIRKPAKLSDSEFNLIKTHSSAGHHYLTGTAIGDEEMWHGVLHHHEKFNGKGYPSGLRGLDIPLWSRIIAVADVYDALTSDRPYRTPMQPAEAIEYIMGGCGADFDFDVVSALVRKIDMYPPGSVVELSNGQYALVLNNENTMRPMVELLGSGDIVDLYRERNYLNVVVKRVLPAHLL